MSKKCLFSFGMFGWKKNFGLRNKNKIKNRCATCSSQGLTIV